jgi:hypothetical protein
MVSGTEQDQDLGYYITALASIPAINGLGWDSSLIHLRRQQSRVNRFDSSSLICSDGKWSAPVFNHAHWNK